MIYILIYRIILNLLKQIGFGRCLRRWSGLMKPRFRLWNDDEIERISKLLVKVNETKPHEIHRSIRTLGHLAYWKGTEYRTILLYVGIVVFKKVLPLEHYTSFLKLACAARICNTNAYGKYLPLARILFNEYIEECINLDGMDCVTSNIHHLSHIVDDVENLGNLESINAYAFENTLFQMKSVLKQCNRPLEQFARRERENEIIRDPFSFDAPSQYPKMSKYFEIDNGSARFAFKHVEYKDSALLIDNFKNQWVLLNDDKIVKYEFAFKCDQGNFIRGQPLKRTSNFFTQPFNSKYLDIFVSDGECSDLENFNIINIKAKLFCIMSENMLVYLPLLHTL